MPPFLLFFSIFNSELHDICSTLTANMIIPVLIEKNCVKKMISQKWGRILNCSSIFVTLSPVTAIINGNLNFSL